MLDTDSNLIGNFLTSARYYPSMVLELIRANVKYREQVYYEIVFYVTPRVYRYKEQAR